MSDAIEEWRPVPGFPIYEVSDHGRVRSVDRVVEQIHFASQKMMKRNLRGVILKTTPDPDGYATVNLYVDRKMVPSRVYRLVLLTFVGPRPDGMQGCHNDGDNANNRLSNLRYDTPAANTDDALRHGVLKHSEAHYRAKLTRDQIRKIRAARGVVRQVDLAEEFGVPQPSISAIQLRKVWRHVE